MYKADKFFYWIVRQGLNSGFTISKEMKATEN